MSGHCSLRQKGLFQPPTELCRVPPFMPNRNDFDLAALCVHSEIHRVRPVDDLGFSDVLSDQTKAVRLLGNRLKIRPNFLVKTQTDARFTFFITSRGLAPLFFGLGVNQDRETHPFVDSRVAISANICPAGLPRPGFPRASSARRSSSAVSSGVKPTSSPANSSRNCSTTSRRSSGGSLRICSTISVALTPSTYQSSPPHCPPATPPPPTFAKKYLYKCNTVHNALTPRAPFPLKSSRMKTNTLFGFGVRQLAAAFPRPIAPARSTAITPVHPIHHLPRPAPPLLRPPPPGATPPPPPPPRP